MNQPLPGQTWVNRKNPEVRYEIVRVCDMTYRFEAVERPAWMAYRPTGHLKETICHGQNEDRYVALCRNGYVGLDWGRLVFMRRRGNIPMVMTLDDCISTLEVA